jgi:hypothetical protein
LTHIAIVEQLDGKRTDWMEKVSDTQYRAPVCAQRAAFAAPAGSSGSAQPTPRKD